MNIEIEDEYKIKTQQDWILLRKDLLKNNYKWHGSDAEFNSYGVFFPKPYYIQLLSDKTITWSEFPITATTI